MRHEDRSLATTLAPVREALLARAHADADAIRATSEADARAALAAAAAQAEQILREARQQGTAEADMAVAADRSAAQRHARSLALRAQREAYERLRVAARAKVCALRDEPDFPAARDRMVRAVRAALGPDALISDTADGGVVGVAPARRMDLSLRGFADRATDTVAAATAEEQA
jgi:vacuolar-type H+-ATPase subunit E/Vma4